jgi:hydroxyacylglutathione hydrolase
MNIQRFVCNAFQENCYVVSDETNEGIIVDCGAYYEEERKAIVKYIKDNRITIKHLLLTHAHIDHCFGNDTILAEFGLKPEFHSDDLPLYNSLKLQAQEFCGIDYDNVIPEKGKYVKENEIITFGNHQLKVLHTPGHTPGSVTYFDEKSRLAFSGDTLFRYSIGRTDFFGGNYDDMMNSLHNVIAHLPADTIVMTGHGEQTSIKDELAGNPYLAV